MCQGMGDGSGGAGPDLNAYAGQSPMGGPQGTQAPQANPMMNRLKKFGKGFQGGMQGAQMMQQRPQQGMEYRPQQLYSQEIGPGPLTGGMLGDYMRNLSASQGTSY